MFDLNLMASSAVLLAKRSLVRLLLRLAAAYQVVISINRDATDVKVTAAFRKVVLKVHPDKGGKVADAQELQAAKATWEQARRDAPKNSKKGRAKEAHNQGGRKAPKSPADSVAVNLADPEQARKQYHRKNNHQSSSQPIQSDERVSERER